MSIKPDYCTLDGLLHSRLFRIPEFQRAYSWEKKQRSDLFGDLLKLKNNNEEKHHFMATIVCLKTTKKEDIDADEYNVFDVVDGQQRLTTLIILLKAVSKALSKKKDKTSIKAVSNLEELLVKGDRRLILLQTNHDSSFIFKKYLDTGKIKDIKSVKTAAERNLIEAFIECEDFVEKWANDLIVFLKILKNRLDFIFYMIEDEGAVYTIFEVLNSRGLEVDWLDKCKSMLMGIAYEKLPKTSRSENIDELHKVWTNIYKVIGLRKVPGHEILRFAATLKHPDPQSKILAAEHSMEYFREFCEKNPKSIVDISLEIFEISKNLEQLYGNSRLKAVTDIVQARLLAVSILMSETFNKKEEKDLLEEWEKVTFRIFGLCGKDARTAVAPYTKIAQIIIQNNLSKNDVVAEIKEIGEDNSDFQIQEAVKNLENTDCYSGWSDDLRYFFYRYEEFLANEEKSSISKEIWDQIWFKSPTTTIEHIFPQSPGKEWKGKMGRGQKWEKHVHRLGNLMILPPGINSKAGNKSFVDKKKIYKKNYHLKLMKEVINKRDWNLKAIIEREKKLIAWAENTWS